MAGESGRGLVDELYGYSEKRLEKALKSVENAEDIPREDRDAIVRFCLDCLAEGMSKARVVKYAFTLKTLARMLGKGFGNATKDDVKQLVARIELSRYSPWTKRDFKVALRKFYRWLKGTGDYPEEVEWMKVSVRGWCRLMPEEILTEEEVWRLVGAAGNPRDRALVAVADSTVDVLNKTLARLNLDESEVITIYYGAETEPASAEKVGTELTEQHPQLQVEVVRGDQPHYEYIISVE